MIFYYDFVKQLVISKIDTIIVIVWLQCYQNPSPAISQRSELGQLAANNLQGPVPKLSSTALFCCKKESKSEKSPSPVWLSTTLISSSSWGGKNYISRNIAKGTAHSARHCLLVQNKRWLQIFTNLHLQIWFKFFLKSLFENHQNWHKYACININTRLH